MFVGKPKFNNIFLKKDNPVDIMLNIAYMNPFRLSPFMTRECGKKSLTRTSVLLSPLGPSSAILANVRYYLWHTDQRWQLRFINNIFTLFCRRKASLGTQQRLKSRAVLMINKVLYVEALPLGQTHCPFITVYIPFLIGKVYLWYTFHWHSAKKLITLSLRGKTTFCHDINRF